MARIRIATCSWTDKPPVESGEFYLPEAHSPEAKGRVERMNGTFQDRLVAELRLADTATLAEANEVLACFLLRFNERFGVPAAQAGSAYRPVDPVLDLGGVLCIKERRRVARDNTVQYHGRTLQLFPGTERPSYARAHVEVQERLDGRVLVAYRDTVLTPQEAPPLAATLRAHAARLLPVLAAAWPEDPEHVAAPPTPPSPLIWYEDSALKARHRDLVKVGMARARQEGTYIGRPQVSKRVDVRFVMERRAMGESWRQIALAHPPLLSASGRVVRPSIGSIRRAVEPSAHAFVGNSTNDKIAGQ